MLFKNIYSLRLGRIPPIPSLHIYQKSIASIIFPTIKNKNCLLINMLNKQMNRVK